MMSCDRFRLGIDAGSIWEMDSCKWFLALVGYRQQIALLKRETTEGLFLYLFESLFRLLERVSSLQPTSVSWVPTKVLPVERRMILEKVLDVDKLQIWDLLLALTCACRRCWPLLKRVTWCVAWLIYRLPWRLLKIWRWIDDWSCINFSIYCLDLRRWLSHLIIIECY